MHLFLTLVRGLLALQPDHNPVALALFSPAAATIIVITATGGVAGIALSVWSVRRKRYDTTTSLVMSLLGVALGLCALVTSIHASKEARNRAATLEAMLMHPEVSLSIDEHSSGDPVVTVTVPLVTMRDTVLFGRPLLRPGTPVKRRMTLTMTEARAATAALGNGPPTDRSMSELILMP